MNVFIIISCFLVLPMVVEGVGPHITCLVRKTQKIWMKNLCNGVANCVDGTDELKVNHAANHTLPLVSCNNAANNHNGSCFINRYLVCNEKVTCVGKTPCDIGCTSHFLCPSGTCVKRTNICDKTTCNDCPTVSRWNNGHGFKCVRYGHKCTIPQVMVYDGVQDCTDGSDLCYVADPKLLKIPRDIRKSSLAKFNFSLCFLCLDGSMIVPRTSMCDGVIDCPDMSDECLCESSVTSICNKVITYHDILKKKTSCKIGQLLCDKGKCIDRFRVCDGVLDCNDGMDEKYRYCKGTLPCANATTVGQPCRCTRMATNSCHQVNGDFCTHHADCLKRTRVNFYTDTPEDECSASCPYNATIAKINKFTCNHSAVNKAVFSNFTCRNKNKTVLGTVARRKVCDGVVDCPLHTYITDEMTCRYKFRCRLKKGGVSIPLSQKCDGVEDCYNGVDEKRALCKHKNRYYCKALQGKKVSISKREVCDEVISCDNQKDEMNCTGDGRFYCENRNPLFVVKQKVFNGMGDCTDWSDECPTNRSNIANNALSSRSDLLSSSVLHAFVWIMGILAIFGNLYIFITEAQALKGYQNQSASLRSNHMLVLNLAISDLLMGVYLIMLGAAEVHYAGKYCENDLYWRSSSTCTVMGVLVVLSSEASVMTMVLLTSLRLYAVFNPFNASAKPRTEIVVLLLLIVWAVTWSIACIPLSSHFHSKFTTKAWISDMPFFKSVVVDFPVFHQFMDRMLTFGPASRHPQSLKREIVQISAASSWYDFELILNGQHGHGKKFEIYRYFNYYSVDSVCLPKIFVTLSDKAWGFSLAISIFNFVAFLFVSTAYIVIYKKTLGQTKKTKEEHRKGKRRSKKGKANKQNQEIQRKIIRLIVTDFCCWVPISIMAFLNFSGVSIPSLAYAISAIILLPINSALNPIVYSNLLDKLMASVKRRKHGHTTSRASSFSVS